MNSRVQTPKAKLGATPSPVKTPRSSETGMPNSLFRTIPPERVGLDGEYDHGGLAKRVLLSFQAKFASPEIEGLRVAQRGRVVILMGNVSSCKVLVQLVEIALNTDGAADVETNGVRVRN